MRPNPTFLSTDHPDREAVPTGRLAALGGLAAGAAHEINNPLFAILGLTEFLLKEAEPGSRAHERLELVQQSAVEIREIVRALLDFAHDGAEEPRAVPLEDVMRAAVDLSRRTDARRDVDVEGSYEAPDALVEANPDQLVAVFVALFAALRQGMPRGGTVSTHVRREGDEVVATVATETGGACTLRLPLAAEAAA